MEIKTLIGIDTKIILNAFNHSFSDYFIPFRLTEEQIISKMLADKTALNLSVGVFEEGQLIAFILHGFEIVKNKKMVYNGGTGVIPEKRGFGLTNQMYRYILPILIKNGINTVKLEVISTNIQAITSYKKSGFRIKRELCCYKGILGHLEANKAINIIELHNYNWELMELFWDNYPSWQNSKNVLNQLKDKNISLGAYVDNKLIGYLIYNPLNSRIQQIAVHTDFRKKRVASTLLLKLKEKYGTTLSIINIDKSSTVVNTFFKKIGLEKNLEQLEMELNLP